MPGPKGPAYRGGAVVKRASGSLAARMAVLVVLCVAVVASAQEKTDPALDKYYSANALYNRRLFKLAAAEYKAFLAKNAKHAKAPAARYGLALSLYHMGDLKAAAPLFGKLAETAKAAEKAQVYNLWGVCLLSLDKNAEAEKAFAWTAANATDAGQKENGLVGLIEAQYRQEKWQEVVQAGDAFIKQSPKSPHSVRVRFHAAVARYKLKQYDKAAVVFKELIAAGKESPFAHHATFLLAECKRHGKDLAAALTLYDEAAKKHTGPYSEDAFYQLGFIRFAQGKYEPAIKNLTAFLAKYKTSRLAPQAGFYLARAYLETKNYAQAAATLTPLTAQKPVAAAATLWLAKTYSRQKNYPQAIQTVSASLAKFSKDPLLADLQYELGDAQMRQGKFKEAAELFAKVIAAGPKKPEAAGAVALQAYCLHKIKQYADSLKLCESFLASHAEHDSAADVLFLKAENLLLTQKLDDALAAYLAFVKAHPKHDNLNKARFRIAQVYYQQKKWTETLAAVKPLPAAGAKAAGPFFDQLYFLMGDSHFRLKDWDKAIPALEKFITEKPKQANVDVAMFNLALAYQHKSQPAKAAEMMNKLAAAFPKSSHTQKTNVERGRLFYEAKQYAQARAALAAPAAANNPRALYYMGWIALAEKKLDEAAGYFSTLAEKHPKHALTADAVLQHAILQVNAKEFAKGQKALSELLKAQPKHPKLDNVIFYLGLCMARQKQWPAAIQNFKLLLSQHPKSTVLDRALYEWAWCEKGADNPAAAAGLYARFLAEHASSPLANDVAFELAELEFEGKKYDESIARLQKLTKTVPKELQPKVLYRLGWCYFNKNDMAKAVKSFEEMLAADSKSPMATMAHYQAGEAHLKLKAFEPARDHFAAAAGQKSPIQEQSLLRLGECQALTSQWPQSQQTCASFLKSYPKSKLAGRAILGLGWALENQQKYAEAMAEYRKVVAGQKRDQTSARCQFQIGECLFAMKKYDEAIKELTLVEVKYGFAEWNAKALLEIGKALQGKGDTKAAADTYKEVVAKYADTDAATVAKSLLTKLSPS